jgi:ATP-dependent Clp protease adaptor protein ClpS|nr:ATP-dependent Clp protease adapter ClpS [Neorhizobium tomejilense]
MPVNDPDLLERHDTRDDVRLERPKRYQVVMHNDDFTPFDFVVFMLMRFFSMGQDKATSVMMEVHNTGKGLCGVYDKDVAETKVKEVMDWAKVEGHPLRLTVEGQA